MFLKKLKMEKNLIFFLGIIFLFVLIELNRHVQLSETLFVWFHQVECLHDTQLKST